MRRTFQIAVTQIVEVQLDASKFDAEFMEEFRESFFNFSSLMEHAEHIAQLHARGIIEGEHGDEFIEGYGPAKEMGIHARTVSTETDNVGAA
jgi:hypothetical protein